MIGNVLLKKGLINQTQLDEALAVQKQAPDKHLGEILTRLGHLKPGDFIACMKESMYNNEAFLLRMRAKGMRNHAGSI